MRQNLYRLVMFQSRSGSMDLHLWAKSDQTEISAKVETTAMAARTFALTSEGALPASVNIHIGWDIENAGKQAVLYRYDDVSGMFVELSRYTVTDNG